MDALICTVTKEKMNALLCTVKCYSLKQDGSWEQNLKRKWENNVQFHYVMLQETGFSFEDLEPRKGC